MFHNPLFTHILLQIHTTLATQPRYHLAATTHRYALRTALRSTGSVSNSYHVLVAKSVHVKRGNTRPPSRVFTFFYLLISDLFNDVSNNDTTVREQMTYKECRRKRPWSDLREYASILLGGTEKKFEPLIHYSRAAGRDLNRYLPNINLE